MGNPTGKAIQPLIQGVLLCGLLLGLGCQPVRESVSTPSSSPNVSHRVAKIVANSTDEQLMLTPPKGWTLAAADQSEANADSVRHVRYQDPTEPAHTLTVESRDNASLGTPATDPLDLVRALAKNERQDCKKAEDFNTFTGFENGFATAVRLFICEPNASNTGQLTLLKIIQGKQQTYLVALAHRWSNNTNKQTPQALGAGQNSSNAFDRVAAWSLYLRSVHLCAASGCPQSEN